MKCPFCGAVNDDNTGLCIKCTADLREIQDDDDFRKFPLWVIATKTAFFGLIFLTLILALVFKKRISGPLLAAGSFSLFYCIVYVIQLYKKIHYR